MKGSCAECLRFQKIKGFEDYCCLECTLRLGGMGDYFTKNADGVTVVDLQQKFKDQESAKFKGV